MHWPDLLLYDLLLLSFMDDTAAYLTDLTTFVDSQVLTKQAIVESVVHVATNSPL